MVNRTPKPAIPNASRMKKESLNPLVQILLRTSKISSPKMAQFRPATIPYLGSVILFTVFYKLVFTLVIVFPSVVIVPL